MASSSRNRVAPSRCNPRWGFAAAFLLVPAVAQAQDGAGGTPSQAVGPSLSPEAPNAPPAPGGRAPSFGAPSDPDAWVFRIGGRISGFGQVGLGRERPGDNGLVLHTPPLTVGRSPFWSGPGGTLTFQYGSQTVMAFVSLEASLTGQEWQGYHRTEFGPRMRTAYVAVTPAPIGDLRLGFQVGAFPANYGAPGPWGWGIFGPVLAVHGYGGTATANYTLTPSTQLYLEYGITGVPAVDESQARGTFSDWPEVGLSTIVNHAHVGLSYQNKYFSKLHLARAAGRNMRRFTDDEPATPQIEIGTDGHMETVALELRMLADPYGQLGVTPVFWNFQNARSVHDGIWWGLDWTAGGREMTNKFLGQLEACPPERASCPRRNPTDEFLGAQSGGTGKIAAVSAEYDFSLTRILRHPQAFDGNGPDLRVALAFLPYWTLSSEDPAYDGTSGYFLGANFEHVLTSWLSVNYLLFGESRDAAQVDIVGRSVRGNWLAYNATLGVLLHSDWQSQDRIVIAYSRYFYSDFTDSNAAARLDRDVLTIGGSVAF